MFSNSTEWEIWAHYWCHTCKNDENEDCPIILELLVDGHSDSVHKHGDTPQSIECDGYEPNGNL